MMRLSLLGWLLMVILGCQRPLSVDTGPDWQLYKQRFLEADGRIKDTGNANVSHSEGQGYGLLLALVHDDRDSFARIWRWTHVNLQVRTDKLLMWRRQPGVELAQEDPNNATDGDLLIAWALLEAAERWQMPNYRTEAMAIVADIKRKLISTWQDQRILLPGEVGFVNDNGVTVNPSYWVFPALKAIAAADDDAVWPALIASGKTLVHQARFGHWQLPPDWLLLAADGSQQPAKTARFGYDAIRLPLYWLMAGNDSAVLDNFRRYWAHYQPFTPSWIALNEHVMDAWGGNVGIIAVKSLVMDEDSGLPMLDVQTDYYAASLLLLSKVVFHQGHLLP
ncbi:MAG: hypothetical protein CTY22_06020 [Methylomonas sp.]|nr:MAG: hypothetical protein CTY23_02365 [Methylomonas sp.]PPD26187.1 MAG: hypothetical protein CTY22_06020 [Methylomonas sp.]PPD37904.1 MAG: hypothetical protein CTY21_06015 [Methylomonas sp.]PPD42092.1 MAG: hypothetical protein CTY17_02170 [Methylomonas sp.]PPD53619.1 MAG: hypothetical protein CTY11_06030 [Methylomonas sp.]